MLKGRDQMGGNERCEHLERISGVGRRLISPCSNPSLMQQLWICHI